MKPVAGALLLLAAGPWATAGDHEQDLPAMTQQVRPAVARVVVYNKAGKETGIGNGFFVSANGWFVTERHLIEHAGQVVVATASNAEWIADGMLAEDATNDLALLKLPVTPHSFLALGKTDQLVPNQRIFIISSPLATVWPQMEGVVLPKPRLIVDESAATRAPAEGMVLAVRTPTGASPLGASRRIQLTAALDPDALGSPMVDETGAVIGVVRDIMSDPRLLNFTAAAEAVSALVGQAKEEPISFVLPDARVLTGQNNLAPPKFDLAVLAKRVEPAVVWLVVYDKTGQAVAHGNGFFVSPDGKLITDYHLLDKARRVEIMQGTNAAVVVDGVLAVDPQNDLALLQAPVNGRSFLPLANTGKLTTGQRVAVVGSPGAPAEGTVLGPTRLITGDHALTTNRLEGVVLAVRTLFGDVRRIQIVGPMDARAGGAPVVEEHGAVISLVRAVVPDARLLNFTIPAEAIGKLLAASGGKPYPFQTPHRSGDNADSEVFLSDEWQQLVTAFLLQDWEKMRAAAEALTHRFPACAEGYACLGTAYRELKQFDRATLAYQRAIQLEPENPAAWINFGYNFDVQDKVDEAIAAYRQAIKLKPDAVLAWNKLGALNCRQGKYGDAITAWRAVVRLNQRDPLAWTNLGMSHEGQGQWTDAVTAYRRALQLVPDYPFVWMRLGVVLGQLGQHDEARTAHRRAMELKSDFPMAWLSLDIQSVISTPRDANTP